MVFAAGMGEPFSSVTTRSPLSRENAVARAALCSAARESSNPQQKRL
jgi:hypothetical protein